MHVFNLVQAINYFIYSITIAYILLCINTRIHISDKWL